MIQHWIKYSDHQYFGDWGALNTFTASVDTTAPVLTNPTGTTTGSTTASGSVDTDEGNGTLYYLATTNASELSATIKSGESQAVTATGPQNVTISGLIPETTYYFHYVHDDNSSNESNIVSSSSFITDFTPVSDEQPTGGWWFSYEKEIERQRENRRKRNELEDKAKEIQEEIDRELVKELQAKEIERERIEDLTRLKNLAKQHRQELRSVLSDRVLKAAESAIMVGNYSSMERFERELSRAREEEMFLLQATIIILNV